MTSSARPDRYTVDLAAYPDLVVIYLGMRVEEPQGLRTLEELGPQIRASVEDEPDGLLLHEELMYSQEPLHVGMRQYWRDFDSLEAWASSLPHKCWWTEYLRDRGGTSFWHETYFRSGGFESVYVDVGDRVGLGRIGPSKSAKGPMFSARQRRDRDRRGA
jgi:Domain of unknown function (DUF4188)